MSDGGREASRRSYFAVAALPLLKRKLKSFYLPLKEGGDIYGLCNLERAYSAFDRACHANIRRYVLLTK